MGRPCASLWGQLAQTLRASSGRGCRLSHCSDRVFWNLGKLGAKLGASWAGDLLLRLEAALETDSSGWERAEGVLGFPRRRGANLELAFHLR